MIDPSAIDASVSPCDDFYHYACGNWIQSTPIPQDQSRWTRSFSVLSDQNLALLRQVLEDYSNKKNEPPTPNSGKLGDFYASCMNQDAIDAETKGILEMQVYRIARLRRMQDLPSMLGQLHLQGVNAFFGFGSSPDNKNPEMQIGFVTQGGQTLDDPASYTSTDPAVVKIREAYRSHIQKIFVLAGIKDQDAKTMMERAFGVEAALAKVSLRPEDQDDPSKLYNPVDFTKLQAASPQFDWSSYFRSVGIAPPALINNSIPQFLTGLDAYLKTASLDDIRAYLLFMDLEARASSLSRTVSSEWFDFNQHILNGQKERSPRWKECVSAVSGSMGEALGEAFVAKAFSPTAKVRMLDMIANLKSSLKNDLDGLTWLDDPTRAAALQKLSLISEKIGYPDVWRNYDALAVSRASYASNMLAAQEFGARRDLKKIGTSTDHKEWGMTPQTVNAYYSPDDNSINFPAAILQFPFFSEQTVDAENYGAIGMVIGHEMTHGFDTSGSQYDGHGVLSNWWSPKVKEDFVSRSQCLKDQYSGYQVLPGVNVNGKLTITENIADNGGIKLAFGAYMLEKRNHPDNQVFAGLNDSQQFYVSFAQSWCTNARDEYLRTQVTRDSHSPSQFRVNGPLANSLDFRQAFNCPIGSAMAPVNRCEMW
jgi:endothelin-converting enzyme/putative endopeptidase